MLERLSSDVFPAYAELAESGFDLDALLWHPRLSAHGMIPEGKLKTALQRWAREFHAEEAWFLDETLKTLRGWHVASDWREALRWNPIGVGGRTLAVGERLHFEKEGWEMQLLTWPTYCRRAREEFEQKLAEYEANCRKLAESCGLIRAPHKYSTANLDWFVLYQFAGLPSAEVAGRDTSEKSTDESTVLKGVKAAAKLLGWGQLRTARRISNRKIR